MRRSIPAIESEQGLILRAIQGDRDAFTQLVVHYQSSVYAAVYRMCGEPDLAEDATQQAFIQAWMHLEEFRPGDNLRGWLQRVAINAMLDMLRREKRQRHNENLDNEIADPKPGPEKATLSREQRDTVQQALLELNETSRAILVMREYGELSYREIADALDIPPGTVMSRLNTARTQLKKRLAAGLPDMENDHE